MSNNRQCNSCSGIRLCKRHRENFTSLCRRKCRYPAMSRESLLLFRLTACHVVAINTRITRYRLNDAAGSRWINRDGRHPIHPPSLSGQMIPTGASPIRITGPRCLLAWNIRSRVPLYPRHVALLWISINDNVKRRTYRGVSSFALEH